MRRVIVGLPVLLLGLAGCLHAPLPWSPDGSWIAYTVAVRPVDPILSPGWLFNPGPLPLRAGAVPALGYRLWATRAASNTSVLLEDSVGPLTAPGWSPDGRALAFGRVVTDADRSSRFEVVIIEGLTRRRIISSRPLSALDAEASRLPYQAIAWSPDGRYLAVPQLEPMGLAILQADQGRLVNQIPDGFLPSWSPTGGRLAFYVRSRGHSLQYIESVIAPPRPLIDVGQASQAPGWTGDGSSILAIVRRDGPRPGDGRTESRELVRVQLRGEAFTVEPIPALTNELNSSRDRPVEGVSIAFDRDVENLFCSTLVEGRPHQVTWLHPRENAIFKRFPLVDVAIPVGSLSLSPDGRTLAARAGSAESLASPVLCDTESSDLKCRLIAPDPAARLDWIAILVRAAREVLASFPAPKIRSAGGGRAAVARRTLLPVVTELTANPEGNQRLRRLGRFGRSLCDPLPGDSDLDPATRRVFAEARLFFDYLREDYPSATRALEALEADEKAPEQRVALLTTRAQILLNQGQFASAKRVISFLERIDQPVARRGEWVGESLHLTPEPGTGQGWPEYLATAANQVQTTLNDAQRAEGTVQTPTPDPLPSLIRSDRPFRPAPGVPPAGNRPPAFRRPGPLQPQPVRPRPFK